MAAMAEGRMNLAALQQQDPYITDIVETASQVALYTFNAGANEWEKTEVEGTLFVYTRSASPSNGYTIMNRLSMDNLTEPITKDLEFQVNDPFLLYRNTKGATIYGIWFYDKDECARIGAVMNRMSCESSHKDTDVASNPSVGSTKIVLTGNKAKSQVDIMQMLTKAQDEYVKGGGDGQKHSSEECNQQETKKETDIMQLLNKAHVEYAKKMHPKKQKQRLHHAENKNTGYDGTMPSQAVLPRSDGSMFQQLATKQASHSMQSAGQSSGELLQQLQIPQQQDIDLLHQLKLKTQPVSIPSRQQPQMISPASQSVVLSSSTHNNISIPMLGMQTTVTPSVLTKTGQTGTSTTVQPLSIVASNALIQGFTTRQSSANVVNKSRTSTLPSGGTVKPGTELLSPMVFQATASLHQQLSSSLPNNQTSTMMAAAGRLPGNLTQFMGNTPGISSMSHQLQMSHQPHQMMSPLTKEQLKQTLLSLIQTDDDFVGKIHEAYLLSLRKS
ncbi:uncharacterized protein LOC102808292 [Saccoglossus kowalevskii]|uniref:mRNA-decapping enzyme 1B-like n=1 Tax=Saccoglossus kowalevskii TaxID=10224 RepID=A0ABM0MXA8_SACKO|nr:PREDICTED: mRNA-decapping enzyme 1B-like [Saccoglossus kowalevskii]